MMAIANLKKHQPHKKWTSIKTLMTSSLKTWSKSNSTKMKMTKICKTWSPREEGEIELLNKLYRECTS